jgi:hypothetical protein
MATARDHRACCLSRVLGEAGRSRSSLPRLRQAPRSPTWARSGRRVDHPDQRCRRRR